VLDLACDIVSDIDFQGLNESCPIVILGLLDLIIWDSNDNSICVDHLDIKVFHYHVCFSVEKSNIFKLENCRAIHHIFIRL